MRIIGFPAGALCARPGTDPELFFPDPDTTDYPARVAAAGRVCAACPVRTACLADWMRWEPTGSRHGVIAGTTPDDRDLLAGTHDRPVEAARPFHPAAGIEAA
jgi:WhiB family transcriptional regulator, redox-sensing transcriptional regulator